MTPVVALASCRASRPALAGGIMRAAIAGVMHDTSGPAFRVNAHGQGELIAPLRLGVADPGPRWRCEVERDVCRRDFLKSDTRAVCQLCKPGIRQSHSIKLVHYVAPRRTASGRLRTSCQNGPVYVDCPSKSKPEACQTPRLPASRSPSHTARCASCARQSSPPSTPATGASRT